MHEGRRVTVVLPAYNEEAAIGAAVRAFAAVPGVDEVLVVNNRSRDRTHEEATAAGARVIFEERQGYGAALTRGMRECTSEIIILAEPDNTFVATDVLKLLAYANDFDMVCGTRTAPNMIWKGANMGLAMRMGNTALAKVIQLLYGAPSMTDCGCTLRLIHRDAFKRIDPFLTVTGSHFLPEMVILALRRGVRLVEVPVNYRSRIGESKITGSWRGTVHTALRMGGLAVAHLFTRIPND